MNNKLSSPTVFIVVRVFQSLIFSLVFCRLLFVFLSLFYWSVLLQIKITASDYLFGNSKLLLLLMKNCKSSIANEITTILWNV